jgi:hypothetical protein
MAHWLAGIAAALVGVAAWVTYGVARVLIAVVGKLRSKSAMQRTGA